MPEHHGAVVCEKGHVLSRLLRPGERADPKCGRCGSKTLTTCPKCKVPLRCYLQNAPGGGGPSDNLGNHCWSCGVAYPWREHQIGDAERLLALQSEIEDWDEATKERLREITGEIASGTANPDWLSPLPDGLTSTLVRQQRMRFGRSSKLLGRRLLRRM
jgi:hypothetical protein